MLQEEEQLRTGQALCCQWPEHVWLIWMQSSWASLGSGGLGESRAQDDGPQGRGTSCVWAAVARHDPGAPAEKREERHGVTKARGASSSALVTLPQRGIC